jgi:hypothetical protein
MTLLMMEYGVVEGLFVQMEIGFRLPDANDDLPSDYAQMSNCGFGVDLHWAKHS